MQMQHRATTLHCGFNILLIESDCVKTTLNPNPKTLAPVRGEITDRQMYRLRFFLPYIFRE